MRNDVVIDAGESHVVSVDGLAFVTGVTASTVWLREPLHAPSRRRTGAAGLLAAAASAAARMTDRLRRRTSAGGALPDAVGVAMQTQGCS